MKKKLDREIMDIIIHDAEQYMVDMFVTGEITNVLVKDKELLEMAMPSIMLDRDYFMSEFNMVIGEA
jgi:hypothetical protein